MDDARCKELMVPITVTCYIQHGQYSNEYTEFAVVGASAIGSYIVQELLKNLNKAAGIVKEAIILTCQVPHLSNIQGNRGDQRPTITPTNLQTRHPYSTH